MFGVNCKSQPHLIKAGSELNHIEICSMSPETAPIIHNLASVIIPLGVSPFCWTTLKFLCPCKHNLLGRGSGVCVHGLSILLAIYLVQNLKPKLPRWASSGDSLGPRSVSIIDGSSIRADPIKVSTFLKLRPLTTGKQVQALLGFIGYLRDCIPCFSKIAKPVSTYPWKRRKRVIQDHQWFEPSMSSFSADLVRTRVK